MNLPPFVYVLAFWQALTYVLAGVAGLLAFFGVIPAEYAVSAASLLAMILGVIKWFNIEPKFRVLVAPKVTKKSKK